MNVLVYQYTEADLYKQLSYFSHILDTERCMEKVVWLSICFLYSLIGWDNVAIVHLLSYGWRHQYVGFLLQLEVNARVTLEKEMASIRPVVELAAMTIQSLRDRSAYGWMQLQNFVVTVWVRIYNRGRHAKYPFILRFFSLYIECIYLSHG